MLKDWIDAGQVRLNGAPTRPRARVAAGEHGPQVLFVEHAPVYTAGRRTLPEERPFDGTEVVDVDRGGKITYHGPGQLVGYPIVTLTRRIGPLEYVRRLEQAVIDVLAGYGVAGVCVEGRTGVWLPAEPGRAERKICAIGVRLAHGRTMHGFALNCDADLSWADNIIACGIEDAGVSSLTREAGRTITVPEVLPHAEKHLIDVLG